jgi:hypothetical protein
MKPPLRDSRGSLNASLNEPPNADFAVWFHPMRNFFIALHRGWPLLRLAVYGEIAAIACPG